MKKLHVTLTDEDRDILNRLIKKGTCCVLASIEPLTGKRLVHVRRRRRNREFTIFMVQLAQQYPQAKKNQSGA